MTRLVLVRHGAHDLLTRGVIAGRQPGLHLNALGKEQAQQIAERLAGLSIQAVYSSPLERACETAAPLATKLHLPVQIAEEFNEIDFGAWTNCAFKDLDHVPEWQRWNRFRSSAVTPGGESMLEVQVRAVRKMLALQTRHSFVAIFTHGDIIRAVLAHFLGMHLDLFQRIEIDVASASVVQLDAQFVRVRLLNANVTGTKLLPELRQQ